MSQGSPYRPRWVRYLTPVLVIAVALLTSIGYLGGRLSKDFVANSDHLLLAELIPDLVSGGHLSDWSVPFATYLIPDWPLYSLALLITPSTSLAVAVFAFGQSLLLFAAARRLALVFEAAVPTQLGLAGLAGVALAAVTGAVPLVFLATAYTHFGTSILVLFCLAYLLDWLSTSRPRSLYWSLGISLAAVASDRLFIIWFLVPAALTVGAFWLARRLRLPRAAGWVGAHMAAAAIGLPWGGLIFPERTGYSLELGFAPRFGWRRFFDSVEVIDHEQRLLIPLVALAVLLIGWQLWRRRSLAGGAIDASVALGLGLFGVIGAATTIGTQIAITGVVPPAPRYNISLLLLPLVLAPIVTGVGLASPTGSAVSIGAARALVGLPIAAAVTLSLVDLPSIDFNASPVPSDCFDEALAPTGSSRGVATYWDARPAEVFASTNLDIVSVDHMLHSDITNGDNSSYGEFYDFAISSTFRPDSFQLREDKLTDLLGEPITRAQCGRWLLLDWGPGGIVVPAFSDLGDRIVYNGCVLPSRTAEPTNDCTLVANGATPEGEALAYGPYATLSPGRYEMSFIYSSSNDASVEVGNWVMTLNTVHVAEGPIVGSEGQSSTVVQTLEVGEYGSRLPVFEIQVTAKDSVDLEFESLTITRTG